MKTTYQIQLAHTVLPVSVVIKGVRLPVKKRVKLRKDVRNVRLLVRNHVNLLVRNPVNVAQKGVRLLAKNHVNVVPKVVNLVTHANALQKDVSHVRPLVKNHVRLLVRKHVKIPVNHRVRIPVN